MGDAGACPSPPVHTWRRGSFGLAKTVVIDSGECMGCGSCEEVCPEEAIIMSKDYEMTFSNSKDAVFGKDKLLTPASQLKDRLEFLKQYR